MKSVDTFAPTCKYRGVNKRWDRFRLHHIYTDHNLMVHFETGETCVTPVFRSRLGPADYRFYGERNIIIAATTDPAFPTLLKKHKIALLDPMTNEPVPSSWLHKTSADGSSQQLLVIDLDHMVAVGMSPAAYASGMKYRDPRASWCDRKPWHIRQARGAYYPSPNAAPEGYSVRLSQPYRLTSDEKAHKDSLIHAAKSWWTLSGWEEEFETDPRKSAAKLQAHSNEKLNPLPRRSSVEWLRLKDKEFADLSYVVRAKLALDGVYVERVLRYHRHLDVKYTGSE